MIERVTIEHPEVRRIMEEHHLAGAAVSSLHVELTEEARRNWLKIILDDAHQKLIDVGYLREKAVEETFKAEYTLRYEAIEKSFIAGEIDREKYVNWCLGERIQGINVLERIHQRQFGEEEVGYVPSERLSKARDALKSYHNAHSKLTGARDHSEIIEKLKQEVISAGFNSLEEFLSVNERLP